MTLRSLLEFPQEVTRASAGRGPLGVAVSVLAFRLRDVSMISYYDLDRQAPATCERCGWAGTNAELDQEMFRELMELNCPKCDGRFFLVMFPTLEDIKKAAGAGNAEAISQLRDIEAHRTMDPEDA